MRATLHPNSNGTLFNIFIEYRKMKSGSIPIVLSDANIIRFSEICKKFFIFVE